MANPKKDIFLSIRKQVLDQVKEINHMLLFNNQFDRDNEEEAFSYPNCFFEYVQLIWNGNIKQTQTGETQIKLHLGFERYETESLTIFDTIQKVYLALQGFSDTNLFTGLQRIEEEQDTDHDQVIVWTITFSTQITDCEANPDATKQQIIIGDLEIIKKLDIDNPIIRTGDGKF